MPSGFTSCKAPLLGVGNCLLAVSSQGLFSVDGKKDLECLPFLTRTLISLDQGLTSMTSPNLNHLHKGRILHQSHIRV